MGVDKLVETGDWAARNRFLSFALTIFGVVNFACWVHRTNGKDDTDYHEVFCAAVFFCMLGGALTIFLTSMSSFEDWQKLCVMFILFIAGVLLIAAFAIYVDDFLHGKMKHGGYGLMGTMLMPCFLTWLIAFDLHAQKLDESRWRIIAYGFTVMICTLLLLIHHSDHGSKAVFVGYILVFLVSLLVMIVHGVMEQGGVAAFNTICALTIYIGLALMLLSDGVCSSGWIVWWLLLFAVSYVLAQDAQEGGSLFD